MSCLTWAAGRGHADIVKELLLHGAKVNTADKVSNNMNMVQIISLNLVVILSDCWWFMYFSGLIVSSKANNAFH